jgi:hypothetical protein
MEHIGTNKVKFCLPVLCPKIQRLGYRKLLDNLKGKERILSFEGGSSGSHYVESSLWKRLWTCRKTDY